ncbi:MAG: hypothetical protein F4027_06440 [Rhodospirillaceae bacterium]|nr:hypothetical protein [Rhodospirillaceae bacterium]MYH37220.1 hypothetical protein [Rhodospirillaceae bacterium]MYK13197.1 hypothetical protein [Rhodospirillaceae bacterium]MYK58246.1 hypothetical protein [Rhodospirillaceae bacterium]
MPTAATLHRLRDRIRRLEQGCPAPAAPGSGAAGGDTAALHAALSAAPGEIVPLGLPAIDAALPWGGLPRGAVHEILCGDPGDGAPTAFLLALIGRQKAAGHAGPVLWASCRRDLFAPALPVYGCDPADFLFVRCRSGEEVLWAMEDGLRCPALAAVAGDVGAPDFSATRRLQLAAGRGGVPLFLHRPLYGSLHRAEKAAGRGGGTGKGGALAPSAAVTRWAAAARLPDPADPSTGFGAQTGDPAWTVHLHRCRGGRPGRWPVVWNRRQQAFEPAAAGALHQARDRVWAGA